MWWGGTTARPFALAMGRSEHLVWAKRGVPNRTSLKWLNPTSLLHLTDPGGSSLPFAAALSPRSATTGHPLDSFLLTTLWPRRLVHPEGDGRGCKGWRGPEPAWSSGVSWPCSFRAALQGGASSCASPSLTPLQIFSQLLLIP